MLKSPSELVSAKRGDMPCWSLTPAWQSNTSNYGGRLVSTLRYTLRPCTSWSMLCWASRGGGCPTWRQIPEDLGIHFSRCTCHSGILLILPIHFSFGYTLFICLYTFHSGIHLHIYFSFCPYTFYSGIHFSFGYTLLNFAHTLFIRVYTFHSGIHFSFAHTLFILPIHIYSLLMRGHIRKTYILASQKSD